MTTIWLFVIHRGHYEPPVLLSTFNDLSGYYHCRCHSAHTEGVAPFLLHRPGNPPSLFAQFIKLSCSDTLIDNILIFVSVCVFDSIALSGIIFFIIMLCPLC
jgi:hypothetical protein